MNQNKTEGQTSKLRVKCREISLSCMILGRVQDNTIYDHIDFALTKIGSNTSFTVLVVASIVWMYNDSQKQPKVKASIASLLRGFNFQDVDPDAFQSVMDEAERRYDRLLADEQRGIPEPVAAEARAEELGPVPATPITPPVAPGANNFNTDEVWWCILPTGARSITPTFGMKHKASLSHNEGLDLDFDKCNLAYECPHLSCRPTGWKEPLKFRHSTQLRQHMMDGHGSVASIQSVSLVYRQYRMQVEEGTVIWGLVDADVGSYYSMGFRLPYGRAPRRTQ